MEKQWEVPSRGQVSRAGRGALTGFVTLPGSSFCFPCHFMPLPLSGQQLPNCSLVLSLLWAAGLFIQLPAGHASPSVRQHWPHLWPALLSLALPLGLPLSLTEAPSPLSTTPSVHSCSVFYLAFQKDVCLSRKLTGLARLLAKEPMEPTCVHLPNGESTGACCHTRLMPLLLVGTANFLTLLFMVVIVPVLIVGTSAALVLGHSIVKTEVFLKHVLLHDTSYPSLQRAPHSRRGNNNHS